MRFFNLSFILLTLLTGCGGSEPVPSPPPPPPPTPPSIAVTILPAQNNTVSGTVTLSATIQNASDVLAVQFILDGTNLGTEDNTAPYSIPWDTSTASNGAHRIQAAARRSASPTLTSTELIVNVNNLVAPTISFSPGPSKLVLSGTGAPATIDIAFSVTGNPLITHPSCNSSHGSVTLSNTGSPLTLSIPDTDPPSFVVTITCIATNAAGSSQAQSLVDLEYPKPVITGGPPPFSLESSRAFLGRVIFGSGFYPQGSATVIPSEAFGGATLISHTEVQLHFQFDPFNWSPGWYDVTISSPFGAPGGGTSNTFKLAFLGNQNTLSCAPSECFQLDQGARIVRRYRLTDGQSRPGFVIGNLPTAIGVDDLTGQIVVAAVQGISVLRETTQFRAFLLPANTPFFMSGPDVTASAVWTSSDPTVGMITAPGEVVGLDAGVADIVATFNGISRTLPYSVVPPKAPTMRVNPDVWSFTGSGQMVQFAAEFHPMGLKGLAGAPGQDVVALAAWTTSDSSVAKPTANPGEFMSQGPGLATIKATHNGVSASATIVVGPMLSAPDLLLFPPNYFFPDFMISDGAALGKHAMAAAARSGHTVITHNFDGGISLVDLSQSPLQVTSVNTGSEPWSAAITDISGETIAVVFDRVELEIDVVRVSDGQILRSAALPNLSRGGHWQLATFDSGPATGLAAVLSQTDKVLVLLDLNTGQELRRIALSGVPFRIAADNANRMFIVADADTISGRTRFTSVDVASGVATRLNSTTSLLAVGLAVSSDGSAIYVAMRDQFEILPNN